MNAKGILKELNGNYHDKTKEILLQSLHINERTLEEIKNNSNFLPYYYFARQRNYREMFIRFTSEMKRDNYSTKEILEIVNKETEKIKNVILEIK